MSIPNLVEDSFGLLQRSRFDAAMSLACACTDATASSEFGGKVGYRWKAFIKSRMDIITLVGFGGALLVAPGCVLNIKNPEAPNTTVSLDRVIYNTVRCYLLHGASLPTGVEFTRDAFYGERNGGFFIPALMIHALLLAVVTAQSNASMQLTADIGINFGKGDIRINEYWGKLTELRRILGIGP